MGDLLLLKRRRLSFVVGMVCVSHSFPLDCVEHLGCPAALRDALQAQRKQSWIDSLFSGRLPFPILCGLGTPGGTGAPQVLRLPPPLRSPGGGRDLIFCGGEKGGEYNGFSGWARAWYASGSARPAYLE